MPELPEVETVRRGLEPVMFGQRIAAAEVRLPMTRMDAVSLTRLRQDMQAVGLV